MGNAWAFFIGAMIFTSCNNENSANNSTSDSKEVAADTTMTSTAPVARAKKSGKISTGTGVDEGDPKSEMKKDKLGYYNRTEILPAYSGGQTALENYISNNIQYPQDAIDNNVEGVVKVQFGVDENGNVTNVSTVGNKIGYGLEEEAIRVVSKMPKWTPGQIKGKNVKTWRTLPINYRLEES
ncbi:energy transducer TonB [Terrimonas alba]|uniref:energy transducer TonB n=1 Tax=Terrimonas alba TaxID=3349636 RepID=UPI0035F46559